MTDRVVEGPLAPAELAGGEDDPGAGALVVLTGAAEDAAGAGARADRLLAELEDLVLRRTGARRCRLRFRPGAPPGEPAVVAAVRAAHRREAFEAARRAVAGARARLSGDSDAP